MSKAAKNEAPRVVDRIEQVKAVIALMEQGSSERGACEAVGINRLTFRSAALKAGAVDQYARACEAIAQDQVESLESAIADMRNGVIDASQARVEIDARKWIASKVLPKRYGDKLELEHGGAIEHDASKMLSELGSLLESAMKAGQ